MGPNPCDWCPYKKGKCGQRHGGRATCRWTWDYTGASTGQGAPEAEKPEEMLKHIVPSCCRRARGPADTESDSWPPEERPSLLCEDRLCCDSSRKLIELAINSFRTLCRSQSFECNQFSAFAEQEEGVVNAFHPTSTAGPRRRRESSGPSP